MEVFLGSIAIEDYDSMASSLIQMGATNNDVNAKAFARDLEKVFSSIKASTLCVDYIGERLCALLIWGAHFSFVTGGSQTARQCVCLLV